MNAVDTFHNQDAEYWTWLDHHERGFVLHLRSTGPMMHTARCMHLYAPTSYKQATKTQKWCSEDRAALEASARAAGLSIQGCQTCKT